MEDNKREIGGSTVAIWYGKLLGRIAARYQKRSDKWIAKGSKTIISNPTCKFINPFTIIFNFTVDTTDKFQLLHQGDFREKYKEWREKTDTYNEKREQYELDIVEYEKLEDKSDVEAPTLPTAIGESPLITKEMFMIIVAKTKLWYKKG